MTQKTDKNIATMETKNALPRENGELVFQAPWEARAFGLAVALNEQDLYEWREFSSQLASEIADAEQNNNPSDYYARWVASLEEL
ncbi:MAG: nitrile hydratase accessory protein, partial [Gemmatimonadetes bacterium]|nr:nitrile hydratase accessory protein [Gemmatimonadota bacterium]